MTNLYFAYGSNTDEYRMRDRCPRARFVSTATLDAAEFGWAVRPDGTTRATFTDSDDPCDTLHGVLWSHVNRETLDRVEGLGFAYERLTVTVDTPQGPKKAYTYRALHDAVSPPPFRRADALYAQTVAVGRAGYGLQTPGARLVIVYGSLMQGFHNHDVLTAGAQLARRACDVTVNGYRMHDLGSYPGVVRDDESAIAGEAWVVDEATLARLDRLEGHPTFYRRERITARLPGGDEVSAEMYIYRRAAHHQPLVPGGCWRTYNEEPEQQPPSLWRTK